MEPLSEMKINIDTIYQNLKDIYTPEEFESSIERVQKEFADLIDREAAALYLAVESGQFKPRERSLSDLHDSEHVTISGRIVRIDPLKTFNRKDGTTGRVVSLFAASHDREVRISFWENRDIELILSGEVTLGKTIKVINGRVKINNYGTTVNIGSYSKVMFMD